MTNNQHIFSDDDVVQSVLNGNTQNFELLINRYKKKIINFIHKMIADYDEAQSLTQDVFIKVYQSIKNYKQQDNFQAFIFTIAKNLTLNYIKKHKRITWMSGQSCPEDAENRYFRSEETAHTDLEKNQQNALLDAGLKTLKENQRIALILKIYLELPYKKIAEITGWSQSKIETLISRAKSNLRVYVQENENRGNRSPSHITTDPDTQKKMQEKSVSNVLNMRST